MRYTYIFLLIILFILPFLLNSCKDPNHQIAVHKVKLEENRYNVAFLIMDGVYNTELTAPFDIFQHTIFREGIKSMNTFLVANTNDPITSFC